MFGRELESAFTALLLGGARMVPVAWMVPAFGGPTLPGQVRIGLSVALSAIALPQIVTAPTPMNPLTWAVVLAREVAVGVTLGFVAGSLFRAADVAGRLTDTFRGATFAEVISPLSEGRTSPIGELYLLLTVVIFLELGGLTHLAAAVGRSYEAVPVAAVALPSRPGAVAAVAVAAAARMLQAGLGLAAPVMVAMLLADLLLGAIGRSAPQIPLYFTGMPAKALLGVGVVLVGLGAVQAALATLVGEWGPLVQAAAAAWR